MSDWGKIAFYYDYEVEGRYGDVERMRGVVSKSYKYPGVYGMLLHAYNAMQFFFHNCDKGDFDGRQWQNPYSGWNELNTAFDVYFDYGAIDCGGNDLKYAFDSTEEKDMRSGLFDCEGMYGWLYISYTGTLEDGYTLKYGYEYGQDDEYGIGDFRRALKLYEKDRKLNLGKKDKEEMEEMISFFEVNAQVMTRKEFSDFEINCVNWVKEVKEHPELDMMEFAATIADVKNGTTSDI